MSNRRQKRGGVVHAISYFGNHKEEIELRIPNGKNAVNRVRDFYMKYENRYPNYVDIYWIFVYIFW